jgi:hypothetical protein
MTHRIRSISMKTSEADEPMTDSEVESLLRILTDLTMQAQTIVHATKILEEKKLEHKASTESTPLAQRSDKCEGRRTENG